MRENSRSQPHGYVKARTIVRSKKKSHVPELTDTWPTLMLFCSR
jgi:hypothetical protein